MSINHPASLWNQQELYGRLLEEQRLGNVDVFVGEDLREGLIGFNYTRELQRLGEWNPVNKLARGLVWSVKLQRFVVFPFPKFFNYGEVKDQIPDLPFLVTHKMDGALGIIYYWADKWWINTRGSFDSEICQWAQQFLIPELCNALIPGNTYLVEIIGQPTHQVVQYSFVGVVLLGGYDSSGSEIPFSTIQEIGRKSSTRVTPTIEFNSFAELFSAAKALPASQEGYVLRYDNGYRIKIKGDEYCRIHRSIECITPLAIWESMVAKVDIDIKDLPEEFRRDYQTIERILANSALKHLLRLHAINDKYKGLDDKTLGLRIREIVKEDPIATFLFAFRKGTFTPEFEESGSATRRKFYTFFRPTSNILSGYTPSSAVNMFGEEQ